MAYFIHQRYFLPGSLYFLDYYKTMDINIFDLS